MDDADDEKRTLIFNTLANLPQDVLLDIRFCVFNMMTQTANTRLAGLNEILNELAGEPDAPYKRAAFIPAGEPVPGTDYRRTALSPYLLKGDTEGKLDAIWSRLVPQENRVIYNIAHGLGLEDLYAGPDWTQINNWWSWQDYPLKKGYLKAAGVIP